MPEPAAPTLLTDAAQSPLRPHIGGRTDARIDEFDIELSTSSARTWFVEGAALERLAQMTNWDYYEAVRRFQRVLEAAKINSALRHVQTRPSRTERGAQHHAGVETVRRVASLGQRIAAAPCTTNLRPVTCSFDL